MFSNRPPTPEGYKEASQQDKKDRWLLNFLIFYWRADEGIETRCGGDWGGQVMRKGMNTLGTSVGQRGNGRLWNDRSWLAH